MEKIIKQDSEEPPPDLYFSEYFLSESIQLSVYYKMSINKSHALA